ncbi:hypothetical protein LUZ63_017348 [Rhynchospora breviuscula]|uniref:Uncharacterized protein n=1 Tax=Rhynchospora breviuscula TaxID=2022672 RepID=A0A9Q0C2B6_9POAL|nr:hypothetical protein LUZ63_017348 [Rhynchospora breviuscula]
MADTTELSDWELLQSNAPDSSAIRSDYFSLPPEKPIPSSSEEETTDEGGIDSDNPSSHGEIGSDPIHETSFQGIECSDPSSGSGEVEKRGEVMEEKGTEEENSSLGKKRGSLWEMPWEIVKFCLTKVKPAWYIPLAGAILGLVLIGRRMYRIREQKRSASVRASMDGKRVTKFAVRAMPVNEALNPVPILRTSPLAGVTIPVSLLALR